MSIKKPSATSDPRSSPGGSPVSPSPMPGSDEARQMTATSGLKCLESSQSSGRLGLLEKMLLGSHQWSSPLVNLQWKTASIIKSREEELSLTGTPVEMSEINSAEQVQESVKKSWKTSKKSDTMSGRLLFRLAVSVPSTEGTGSSLWRTPNTMDALEMKSQEALDYEHQTARPGRSEPNNPRDQVAVVEGLRLWPTVRGNEMGDYQYSRGDHDKKTPTLTGAVRMYPTITAQDCKNTAGPSQHGRHTLPLNTIVTLLPTPNACQCHNNGRLDEWGGSGNPFRGTPEGRGCLNPTWCELLMGFPAGWTDVEEK